MGGMSVEQLDQIRRAEAHRIAIAKASERLTRLDITTLLSQPAPSIDWQWAGFLERATIAQIHGAGGAGRSILAGGFVRAAVSGNPFLGRDTQRLRAVILDGENPLSEVHRRLERLDYGPVADRVRYLRAEDAVLDDPERAEETLCAHIQDALAELVVLDSQRALWPGEESEAGPVRKFYSMLRRVANATSASILVLHHDNRSGSYSGSGDLNASVDSRMHLVRDDDGSITLTHEKLRSDIPQEPIRYRLHLEDGRYAFAVEQVRTVRGDVLEVLGDGWMIGTEVAKAANVRREDVERELWALTRSGDAEHAVGPTGRHHAAKCWRARQITRDRSGQVAAGDSVTNLSPDLHTPRRGVESGQVRSLNPSEDPDTTGQVDSLPSDEEVERLLELGDDLGLTGGAS
jgi:hypothetical protein